MAALGKIVQSVTAPVNGLAAGGFLQHSIADFANIGIRRISLGSSIARMAQNALLDACNAIFDQDDFAQCPKTVPWNEIDAMLSEDEG